jgi:REP element-mobilizing transposase RayT
MTRDFDDNEIPLAYLITFRCYGTWLHGDERGSMDRKRNKYGTARIQPNIRLKAAETALLKSQPLVLDAEQRIVVERAVREVCTHRTYILRAINVRTNHIHTVVTAACKPEPVLNAFKAYATRELRKARLISRSIRPWSRHGSTKYLWRERQVERANDYVLYGQGDELSSWLDSWLDDE